MEQSNNPFPDEITCPSCKSVLSLDDAEKRETVVTCPACSLAIMPNQLGKDGNSETKVVLPSGVLNRISSLLLIRRPIREKFLFTLTAIAIYRIGLRIPLPGVNYRLISDSASVFDPSAGYALFSQGITTYLLGSTFILLLSAFFPFLRRLRDGTEKEHREFDGFIYFATFVCSCLWAWGAYEKLGNTHIAGESIVRGTISSHLSFVTISVAGTMFLVALSERITHKGLANGVTLMILSQILFYIYPSAKDIYLAFHGGAFSRSSMFMLFCVAVILPTLSVFLILAKRTIRLERLDKNAGNGFAHREPPTLPIRVMATGTMPFGIAFAITNMPQSIFSINYSSPIYFASYGVIVILLSIFFTAVTYDPKDIIIRLKRYGYVIAETHSDEEAAAHVDRILIWAILPGILFGCVLVTIPIVVLQSFGLTSSLFKSEVLIICAISLSIAQYLQTSITMNTQSIFHKDLDNGEWISVFSSDTVIEGELVRDILTGVEIDSRLVSNRVISVTGTLAPWEICRPRFPSMMIHPRLGKGSVDVFVRANVATQAQKVLRDRELIEDIHRGSNS